LQRDTNVDPATAVQSKSLMKVQGDKLVVASPQQFQKPTKPVAPKVVKEKLAQAPVERGWEPVGDAKAQAELREKIRKEDPKSVPPPTAQASDNAATHPGASPNKQRNNVAPSAPVPPAAGTTEATAPPIAPNAPKEKPDTRKVDSIPPASPPAPRVAASPTSQTKHRKSAPDSTRADASDRPKHEPPAEMAPTMKKAPPQERMAPPSNAPANQPPPAREDSRRQKKDEPAAAPTP
jgi:hypothetical protein